MAERPDATRHRDRGARQPGGAARARDRGRAPRSDAGGTADRGDGARPQVVAGAAYRGRTAWRRWGYRLLPGDTFSYILHLRPAEWPIMAGHTALGYLLAVGLKGAGSGEQLPAALAALAIWVICLNGGTLAINSVFDKDEGDIGYLIAPPPIPKHLLLFSTTQLVGGQLLAFTLPPAFRIVYALCFAMSVLYSVPPFRFKAVAGVDWLINMWGFGSFTPFATWAATGRSLDLGHALLLLGFCPLFAGLYPLTQLYQLDEDRRRGDRTLALILGMRRSLGVAIACVLVAFALFVWAAVVLGAGTSAATLGVALAVWLGVLAPWYARHAGFTPVEHQRGMYRALTAWAVTDVTVLAVFAR